ncbi:hypothetical protein L3Q82_017069, partial [Scortum barcoo]
MEEKWMVQEESRARASSHQQKHCRPPGLCALLYSLFTHDCVATHSSNTIVKFADDTTVIGLITGDDLRFAAYREEVRALTSWCQDNNLQLNISKTKELIVDFRRRQREEHAPLSINGTTVERVSSFSQTAALLPPQAAEEAQHGLQGYSAASTDASTERILTGCITAWYSSCTALNRKALQRVVKAAQHITRTELPSMEDLYTQRSFEPEPPGSGKLHTAGHKTFKLPPQHHHSLTTPPL